MLQCARQVQEDTAKLGLVLKNPLAFGILQQPQGSNPILRLHACILLPEVELILCTHTYPAGT